MKSTSPAAPALKEEGEAAWSDWEAVVDALLTILSNPFSFVAFAGGSAASFVAMSRMRHVAWYPPQLQAWDWDAEGAMSASEAGGRL
mmetsp:Transcript_71381/g.202489  ORF Transcript_71381/g.202489 Transcript_71381/m.202489 type:complete len:87 (+) Transcript_71381:483-743(+)